jgi:hypothetical protein
MTSVNYPNPVTVNGYSCKNCTDVDYAKKNVDPAHPKDGPYGVNAKPASGLSHPKAAETPAVTFGGVLAGISQAASSGQAPSSAQGLRFDVSA